MTASAVEPTPIETGTVITVVTEAFAGLFGEFEPPPVLAEPSEDGLSSAATVSISGEWTGHVRLECSDEFSVRAASELFLLTSEELSALDVRDALGELANIIGGTIKSLLPGPSQLSLPSVVQNRESRQDDRPEISRVYFRWHDQPIKLTVCTSGARETS